MTKRKRGVLDSKKEIKDIVAEKLREESTKWSPDLEIHCLVKITTGERSLVTGIFQRPTQVSSKESSFKSFWAQRDCGG